VIIIAGNGGEETLKVSEMLLTYFQTFEQIGSHYVAFEDQTITRGGNFESFELKSPLPIYGIFIGIGILDSALAVFIIAIVWQGEQNPPKQA